MRSPPHASFERPQCPQRGWANPAAIPLPEIIRERITPLPRRPCEKASGGEIRREAVPPVDGMMTCEVGRMVSNAATRVPRASNGGESLMEKRRSRPFASSVLGSGRHRAHPGAAVAELAGCAPQDPPTRQASTAGAADARQVAYPWPTAALPRRLACTAQLEIAPDAIPADKITNTEDMTCLLVVGAQASAAAAPPSPRSKRARRSHHHRQEPEIWSRAAIHRRLPRRCSRVS